MTLEVVLAFTREQQKRENKLRKKEDEKAKANQYTELAPNDDCREFVAAVDSVFREAFENMFGKFFSPMDSIVSKQDILDLIEKFKQTLPFHFEVIKHRLNFAAKQGTTRGVPVLEVHERKVFFAFLSDIRMSDRRSLTWWAAVMAADPR